MMKESVPVADRSLFARTAARFANSESSWR